MNIQAHQFRFNFACVKHEKVETKYTSTRASNRKKLTMIFLKFGTGGALELVLVVLLVYYIMKTTGTIAPGDF